MNKIARNLICFPPLSLIPLLTSVTPSVLLFWQVMLPFSSFLFDEEKEVDETSAESSCIVLLIALHQQKYTSPDHFVTLKAGTDVSYIGNLILVHVNKRVSLRGIHL